MRNISAIKVIFLFALSCSFSIVFSPPGHAQNAAEDISALKDENTKLKDEISYLEGEVAALDNARTSAEDTNRAFSRRMAELQTELQSLKEAQDKLDKHRYQEAGRPPKSVQELKDTIGALEVERAVYIEKKKALDKQLKEASSDFYRSSQELQQLKTECAFMHYNLGVIFQKANKWREAIREYQQVLEILPNDADTHFNLALIYETSKNDRDKAVYHYQKYLEANPSASDNAAVKERITNIKAESRVWGEPHLGGIKERTGRFW